MSSSSETVSPSDVEMEKLTSKTIVDDPTTPTSFSDEPEPQVIRVPDGGLRAWMNVLGG